MIKVKICGIKSEQDVALVNKYKPDYIGFVFAKSKREVSFQKAIELKKLLSSDIKTVGVFVNKNNSDIINLLNDGVIDVAQLHGNESEDDIKLIQQKTGKVVVKALSVTNIFDILKYANSSADYLLLDNGKGGTGKSFNWSILEELKKLNFNKPYFLAGGLNTQNIKKAISYNPYCVDVSGGVETLGNKDETKIKDFIKLVKG